MFKKIIKAAVFLTVCAVISLLIITLFELTQKLKNPNKDDLAASVPDVSASVVCANSKLEQFASEHKIPLSEYPKELIKLLESNPDAEEFVLNYPLLKDKNSKIDLSEYKNCTSVPRLYQWDSRWGYNKYGSGIIGINGCGPTCLSMVAIYITKDTSINPDKVARFCEEKGYYAEGNGTKWSLMSKGAKALGLSARELPLHKNTVMENLRSGKPVICIMGPGDFTSTGHYIVLTGVKNGKITINDPNSKANSEKLWEFEDIKGQIKNLWAYGK